MVGVTLLKSDPKTSHRGWRPYLLLLGLVLVLIVLRIPYTPEPFWIIDEALYASIASKIVDGGKLYVDGWDNKPPFIYYFYAGVFALFGKGNLQAVHLATLLLLPLALVPVFKIGADLFGTRAGLLAAAAMVVYLTTSPIGDVQASNTELFLMPILAAAFYLSMRAARGDSGGLWVATGFLLGLGLWIKQPALLFTLLVPGIAAFYAPHEGWDRWGRLLKPCLAAFAGFLAALAAGIGFLAWEGILPAFYKAVIEYNLKVHVGSMEITRGLKLGIYTLVGYVRLHCVSLCLAGAGIFLAARSLITPDPFSRGARPAHASLLLWLGLGLASTAIGLRFYGFYFILASPAICLFIGLALDSLARAWNRFHFTTRAAFAMAFAVGIGLPLFICHQNYLKHLLMFSSVNSNSGSNFTRATHLVSVQMQEVVRYIRGNSRPEDKIFVWGYFPQIYVLADRHFASPYNSVALQTGFLWGTLQQASGIGNPEPFYHWVYPELESYRFTPEDTAQWIVPGSLEGLLQSLQAENPELFIDGNVDGEWPFGRKYPISSFPVVQEYLSREYRLEKVVMGYRIYRRNAAPTQSREADSAVAGVRISS